MPSWRSEEAKNPPLDASPLRVCIAPRFTAFDNAVIESFWARLQTELLNRKKWKTRIELSTALFEYFEIFHNRNRRHSSLGMLTPIEYEKVNNQTANAA